MKAIRRLAIEIFGKSQYETVNHNFNVQTMTVIQIVNWYNFPLALFIGMNRHVSHWVYDQGVTGQCIMFKHKQC